MTTSERVVEILVGEGGYRELPKPLKVGSLSFEFTHVLVAGAKASDLVIVIELKGDTADDSLIRKVHAFTRALDVLRSKRSVTAVLTSGQAMPETVQSMSKVCRVLPVGAPTGPKAAEIVRDWLSVLLPLKEPVTVESSIDWETDLRRQVPANAHGALMEELINVAPRGKIAVEEALAQSIKTSAATALEEKEEDR
jgi:hypothetical protein